MSVNRFTSIAVICAALGAAAVTSGCGSTPTSASFGEQVDDSVITSKVKAKFVEDKAVSALDISVETFKGIVQLSGFANSSDESTRAAEIARGVTGVKSVKNDIRLKS